MHDRRKPSAANGSAKLCILLMDANSDRRALRTKIMALHAVEVVGVSNLIEARSIWNRDRYDMVLIDIRQDYHGCLAWRDEIKKEKPTEIVAFLVGGPRYVDLEPLENSYVTEAYAAEWGDSVREAVTKSCESLPQRNGLAEAIWRIKATRRIHGVDKSRDRTIIAPVELRSVSDVIQEDGEGALASSHTQRLPRSAAAAPAPPQSFATELEKA